MKKRLRKKLHLGEFREYGFELKFAFSPPLTEAEWMDFYDDFIDMIESNGLQCGGGVSGDGFDLFVSLSSRGTATEEHRQIVGDWLARRGCVGNVQLGELRDAWHGWNKELS